MKGINEMYYRRTHNNLPEQDLNHMTNALMINVQEVLKADSVFPAGVEAITLVRAFLSALASTWKFDLYISSQGWLEKAD